MRQMYAFLSDGAPHRPALPPELCARIELMSKPWIACARCGQLVLLNLHVFRGLWMPVSIHAGGCPQCDDARQRARAGIVSL